MTPESVGIKTNRLVLGKHSGRHALGRKLTDLGYELTRPQLDKAYARFIEIADQKKEIFDEDLIAIVHEEMKEIPETFKLKVIRASAGSVRPSTSTVTLEIDGREESACSMADGPVSATYTAIDQITKLRGRLVDYSIRSVSRGRDAIGEVFVHVDFGGKAFTGKSVATDVVEASARAYLHAVNKAIHLTRSLERAVEPGRQKVLPRVSEMGAGGRAQTERDVSATASGEPGSDILRPIKLV
jgi:2-isopropylmalate synthase